ncbi:MAG: hypothetical protein COT17_08585 [Elusimicrobia bacterium CG08_land_8_20_14_0_20_51_18]|nr:MAG: hypothetical protein COT17_08585 [Elusimicrobia bacterium CG08_land_8_20_14_0_20_51_18]
MIFNSIKGKTVFITGSRKNCGKTTLLNYILRAVRPGNPAYLSIGLDGEKKDRFAGNLKPHIAASENDIVLTNSESLKDTDASFKLLNVYNFTNSRCRPVLVRIMRPGRMEISGPGENSRLELIFSDMRKAGAETILVDGAFDRITQIAAGEDRNFFYVAGVEPENLISASASVSLIYSMSRTPVIKENRKVFGQIKEDFVCHGETLFLKGAVTSSKLEGIGKTIKCLVFEDLTKIFLDYSQWKALNRKYKVFFASKINLISFIVNLYNISRKDFENCVAEKEALKLFVYNPYERL